MPSMWVAPGPDRDLVPLEKRGYDLEAEFQDMLATNPAVLASAIDDHEDAAGWLLVDQELDIAADESGRRWRLDHLFIDGDGTPVLVEVKRSSDPRIRREVVAQMLDYAASFNLDWDATRLRNRWEARVANAGEDRDQEMDALLNGRMEEAEFWSEVQTRTAAGMLRLLFVADQLPESLLRIISYLNAQMGETEVLGVEVARHTSDGAGPTVYAPVVHGRASPRGRSKNRAERRSEEEFLAALLEHQGQAVVDAVEQLVQRAADLDAWLTFGTAAANPRAFLNLRAADSQRVYWPLVINPRPGKFVLFLRVLKHRPAFEDEAVRAEYLDRMAAALGRTVDGTENLAGHPWFPVSTLTAPGAIDAVIEVLQWVTATTDRPADASVEG